MLLPGWPGHPQRDELEPPATPPQGTATQFSAAPRLWKKPPGHTPLMRVLADSEWGPQAGLLWGPRFRVLLVPSCFPCRWQLFEPGALLALCKAAPFAISCRLSPSWTALGGHGPGLR